MIKLLTVVFFWFYVEKLQKVAELFELTLLDYNFG